MTNSLAKWLTERDIFGAPITVLYKGSDVFKTKSGAACTIVTYILILFYFVGLISAFIDMSKQEEKSQSIALDRYNAGRYYLDENDFELVIATPVAIPPQAGKIIMHLESNNDW